MRTFALLVLLTACGGSIATTTDAGVDSATPTDASTGSLASFCQGTTPKMQENGKDNPILQVTGKGIIMNCCNAAAVTIATAQHAALFHLRWQQYGAGPSPVVLGSKQVSVELDLGCDPTTTTCSSSTAVDRYVDGFSGTIEYAYAPSGMTVSYCVEVQEPPSSPHGLLHSVRLYLPNVVSP